MAEKGNIFQKQENRNLGKLSGKVFLFFRTAWQEISTYKKTYFFYMIGLFLFSLQMLKAKYLPIPTVQKDLFLLMPILILLLGMEYLRRHSHKVFFILASNWCFLSYLIIFLFYCWGKQQSLELLVVFFVLLLYAFYHALYMLLVVLIPQKKHTKCIKYENILIIVCAVLAEVGVLVTFYTSLKVLH